MKSIFETEIQSLKQQLENISHQLQSLEQAQTIADTALTHFDNCLDTLTSLGDKALEKFWTQILLRRNQENNPEDYSLDKQPTDTQTNLNIKETTTSEIGSNEPEVEEKTVENQPKETIIECHNTEEIKTTELIWLSERIAYNYESKSQQILEAYIFGNNQSKAERWARFLAESTTIANQATTEKNTINDQFKYQITLEGIQLADLQKLTEINLNTNHPYSVWGDAPIRPIEPAALS